MTQDPHSRYSGFIQPKGFPGLPEKWVSRWDLRLSSVPKIELYSVIHSAGELFGEKNDPNGHKAIVISHGIGEHGGRYLHAPHYLQKTVSSVAVQDHIGHGRSQGQRGDAPTFDVVVDDLISFILEIEQKLIEKHGKSEIHLLGHSMGGLIAYRALQREPGLPLKSISLSSPYFGLVMEVPAIKKLASKVLSKIAGKIPFPTDLEVEALARDPAVIEAYLKDPLVHSKITPRYFESMMDAQIEAIAEKEGFEVPVQFLIALKDRLVNPETSIQVFNALIHSKKRLVTYPDGFHETINDLQKEKVFTDVADWIKNANLA